MALRRVSGPHPPHDSEPGKQYDEAARHRTDGDHVEEGLAARRAVCRLVHRVLVHGNLNHLDIEHIEAGDSLPNVVLQAGDSMCAALTFDEFVGATELGHSYCLSVPEAFGVQKIKDFPRN